MQEEVTVNEAIKKAKWMLYYPTFFIFITLFCISLIFTHKFDNGVILALNTPLSFVILILYWCFMVTRWRLWAFENVRNVHELKRIAIRENIICPEGSWVEKIEIRTKAQKEKWKELLLKFNHEDIFEDDPSIDSETKIYISKNHTYKHIVFFVITFISTLYMLIIAKKLYFIFLFLISLFFLYRSLQMIYQSRPKLLLNELGITTYDNYFYSWLYIKSLDFEYRDKGEDTITFLTFKVGELKIESEISGLDMDIYEIEYLIKIYILRFNKKNNLITIKL